jgi:hypothetical protein
LVGKGRVNGGSIDLDFGDDALYASIRLLTAVVKVFAFSSKTNLVNAAERCAFFVEDDSAMSLLDEISGMVRYSAGGLLEAKRLLAESTSEAEKYMF